VKAIDVIIASPYNLILPEVPMRFELTAEFRSR